MSARKRVAAYVRAVTEDDDATAPLRTEDGARQVRAIERWAGAHGYRVSMTAVERTPSGLDHIGDRVGFASALTAVREGRADMICIAAMGTLDDDLVVQELLLAEARDSHVELSSAAEQDAPLMRDPPSDAARALVRRVIADVPAFHGEMRSLRAWVRRNETSEQLEAFGPALAELEDLQAHRATASMLAEGDEDSLPHRIASWVRLKRIARSP